MSKSIQTLITWTIWGALGLVLLANVRHAFGQDVTLTIDGVAFSCVAPDPDPDPVLCQWNSDLLAADARCLPCEFDDTLWIEDEACVDPTPIPGLITNPTHPVYACAVGEALYSDRNYVWTGLDSPYDGMQCVRTQNNQKTNDDPDYVGFDSNQPVTVYLATDTARTTGPGWLSDWTPLGRGGVTTDFTGDLWLWTRQYPAGRISIPGNQGSSSTSTYVVLIDAEAAPPPVVGNATVSWDAPTTNEDGTPLTDLAGYKVYYHPNAPGIDTVVDIADPQQTTVLINDLTSGEWFFQVSAYDASDNESALAGPVSKIIP